LNPMDTDWKHGHNWSSRQGALQKPITIDSFIKNFG
jgi:hypothetical protein